MKGVITKWDKLSVKNRRSSTLIPVNDYVYSQLLGANMPYVGLCNLIIKRGTIRGWDINSGLYWHVGSNFGPPILKRGIKIIKKFFKKSLLLYVKKKKKRF